VKEKKPMRRFLKRLSPIVLVILAVLLLRWIERATRIVMPEPAAAVGARSHSDQCPVCKLPAHGGHNEPSKFGPKFNRAGSKKDAQE
jgi:hypothetical protein